jgi:signal transduction histidine kinase
MDKVLGSSVKKEKYQSIYRSIGLHLSLFLFIIFGIFGSIVYVADNELEVISLHHWLDTEFARYNREFPIYRNGTKLPNNAEFATYWTERTVPNWLKPYQKEGFFEHQLKMEDKHFIVVKHPSGKGLMYIVFRKDADDFLDAYEESLHAYILLLGFVMALGGIGYSIFFFRLFSTPLVVVEQKIKLMTPNKKMPLPETAYIETRNIESALLKNKKDIEGFFQRETEFSRFSSHELRTPLMVIKGSVELLAKVPNQPPITHKAINRIQLACEEMQLLTEAFLLLGKESIGSAHFQNIDLKEVIEAQIKELKILFLKQGLGCSLTTDAPGTISAPLSFVSIVVNNIIKNAFSYSISDIQITLCQQQLTITNCHNGNETYQAGYGCGLVIVERICDRMGWRFIRENTETEFVASVYFKNKEASDN